MTMTNESELNKKLHEARGLCWHEPSKDDRTRGFAVCAKCGGNFNRSYYHEQPDYLNDLEAAFELQAFVIEKVGRLKYYASLLHVINPDGEINFPSRYAFDATAEQRSLAAARCLGIEVTEEK